MNEPLGIALELMARRKAVTLRDVLIARVQFAVARRLARLAWRFATAGKRRVAG